jgi:hypothetical protein
VPALCDALKKQDLQPVRILLIEVLAKLGTPDAIRTLAATALEDPIEEVRLTCLDFLQKNVKADAVSLFVGALKSKDNVMVNRAAVALGRMRDPSAIGPLIEALITVHKFKIQGDPNRQVASFGTSPGSGGGGFSFGGTPTKIISQNFANEAVRDALVRLTGKDFSFDKQAWRYWSASQKKPETPFDGRRD